MRAAFMDALSRAAKADSRVCLVVGDLGFSVVESFAESHAHQFVNAGVAEQNMTGLAAGMALSGKVVFTYSIANFPTLRCLEQIRNDICYQGANVRVVAVGGGLAYGGLGFSHHATEDLAIMRSLPGLLVVAPGDPVEAGLATQALINYVGPAYLRLGKSGEPVVHRSTPDFVLGRAITLTNGRDLTLISTGAMLATAAEVAHDLADRGYDPRLISMHTLSPLDVDAITAAAEETRYIFTLEEHSVLGGLGSAVAEVLAEMPGRPARLKRIALPPTFVGVVGDQDYLRQISGLDRRGVLMKVIEAMERSIRFAG